MMHVSRTCASCWRATLRRRSASPQKRLISIASRTYQDALDKLSKLQSNRTTTQLFDKPKGKVRATATDLNAAAIPEMRMWLGRAGYKPSDLKRMRHIHVAGTKGKGSVCAYAASILRQYGDVGTYTSPHLVSPRERIAINDRPVTQETFTTAFFELWDRFTAAAIAEDSHSSATKPFFFRFMTILAWHVFLTHQIPSVVMECGIGGEYDATNVLPADAVSAAVISQLGIDHVAMLGDTVDQIAWHKAGILKPGVTGFTVAAQPIVMDVLQKRAAEKRATLVEMRQEDIHAWGGVQGNLGGDFQKLNQALAVAAARRHLGMSTTTPLVDVPEKMTKGLREARLRGRCEVVAEQDVTWLLDGAHTTDSLFEVAKWLVGLLASDEKVVLVFNQQERDAAHLLSTLVSAVTHRSSRADVFSHAVFTRNELYREPGAVDLDVQKGAEALMQRLSPQCVTAVSDNLTDAIAEARVLAAKQGGKVVVTGSLHLVGGVLQLLEPDSESL